MVQVARLCVGLAYCNHITPVLCTLRWLLIHECVCFKLVYKACTNHLPSYQSSMVPPCSSVKGCSSLSSVSAVVPGSHLVFSFTVAGSSVWNSLPPHVRNSLIETIFRTESQNYPLQLYIWILILPCFSMQSELCKGGHYQIKVVLY